MTIILYNDISSLSTLKALSKFSVLVAKSLSITVNLKHLQQGRHETGDRGRDTGDMKQKIETGDGRQKAGDRRCRVATKQHFKNLAKHEILTKLF